MFTLHGFTHPAFKASETNIRVRIQNEKAEILASLSSTVSVSLSLSVCLNTVAQRGRGRSGRGDVWRRQTDAAWVNQTETKPAVRGSDSGGGEGGKPS